MPEIIIRQCEKKDDDEILNVCYKTGFMGEDLLATGRFNDVKLFGYLFCLYYPHYEKEHCFVAVNTEESDKVIGYILGTDNTLRQRMDIALKMGWRILLRLIFITILKYRESANAVLFFIRSADHSDYPNNFYKDYPAHLHINILPEYQHLGIGTMLIDKFEEHMRKSSIRGIHLRTSNKNIKAIPFYIKKGYTLIHKKEGSMWKGIDKYESLVFAKKL
jgi:GNAT superfamily N-acetyltransferase